jgi:alcohol dehydrogenase class IV
MTCPPFDFFSVPRIVFGRGKLSILPALVEPLGRAILVVHNGGDGPLHRVAAVLAGGGARLVPHRQKGEPTVADIDAAVELARREGCTGVIAVGGGSAIDAGKAAAGLLGNGGSALEYMEVIGRGQKITRPALPWVAVPTTAGTGAEVTRNAVIGEPSLKFKASLRSEHLLPRAAVVDPELGTGVPRHVTACSGMDALCQCIEAYTSTGANILTDALSLRGIELASRHLLPAADDGQNLDAREGMALAALLSGIVLTNAGLGAVHGFAAPIGANFPAPHGAVCAALLPHVIEANIHGAASRGHAAVLDRYTDVGRALSGNRDLDAQQAIAMAAMGTHTYLRDLTIPPLREFGLTLTCVPEMVGLAKKASSMRFNPVTLSDDVLADVLTRAIQG